MNITKEMIKRQAREDILNARLVQEDIIDTPFYVVKGGFATPELFNEIMNEEDPGIENIRINILKNEYFVVILNNRVDEDGNFEEHKRLSVQLKLKEIDNVIDEYYGYVLVPKYVVPHLIYRQVASNYEQFQSPFESMSTYSFENFGNRNPEELGNTPGNEKEKAFVNEIFYNNEEIPGFSRAAYGSSPELVWRKMMIKEPGRHKNISSIAVDFARDLNALNGIDQTISAKPVVKEDDMLIIKDVMPWISSFSEFWQTSLLVNLLWGLNLLEKGTESILVYDQTEKSLVYLSKRRPHQGKHNSTNPLCDDFMTKTYVSEELLLKAYTHFLGTYESYEKNHNYRPPFI